MLVLCLSSGGRTGPYFVPGLPHVMRIELRAHALRSASDLRFHDGFLGFIDAIFYGPKLVDFLAS